MIARPPDPPRDLHGLPLAGPAEERAARVVTLAATVFFTLAAAWELFGPVLAGHYAAAASDGIIAENILRWKIIAPVWEYTTRKPGPELYYCHHPFGIYWTTALVMKVFGRHDFVCRLPPVLLSAMTPPLLHGIGRSVWRPAAGAAAAAAFVVLPITLSFAAFNAYEVPVIAWTLLCSYGVVRLGQTGRRRYVAMAALGGLFALNSDWPGFLLVGALLGLGLVRLTIAPRALGPIAHLRRYAAWWALGASASVLTLLFYLYVFLQAGKISDFFGSYGMRSSGNAVPLAAVLASRRYWIELSFTPIAILLGKIAAVVALARFVWLRREHELLPLFFLVMATIQYLVFKQGADIHIFWPHYFGAYFALAMGAVVATLVPLLSLVPRLGRERAPVAALGIALLPCLAIARDGIPALRYARETGGRFNEKGLLIHSDGAKTAFLHFIEPSLPKDATIGLHEGMKPTWAQTWALGGRQVSGNRPLPGRGHGDSVYLADTRFLLSDHQGQLAKGFHVTAVGPFWKVVTGETAAPIDAYAIVEREPSWWEWYFVSGTEPHREIVPDPWLTWELRTHFGQEAVVPTTPPVTLDQKRIAHNAAVAAGDASRAAALLAEIERALSPVHAAFDDGTEIVGTTFHEGARSLLTIFVKAGGATTGDVQLAVKSKVTEKAALSTTMADPLERDVGIPLAIPPQRWKKGFLYADPVAIRKRPGTEAYKAYFWVRGAGTAPRRIGGPKEVDLLTLR